MIQRACWDYHDDKTERFDNFNISAKRMTTRDIHCEDTLPFIYFHFFHINDEPTPCHFDKNLRLLI